MPKPGLEATVSTATEYPAHEASVETQAPATLGELLARHGMDPDADSGQRLARRTTPAMALGSAHLVHALLGLWISGAVVLIAGAGLLAWVVAIAAGLAAGAAALRLHAGPSSHPVLAIAAAVPLAALIAILHGALPVVPALPFHIGTVVAGAVAAVATVVGLAGLVSPRLALVAQVAVPLAAFAGTLAVV